ncbi:periplasmic heavy metal sensor [Celeribacter sp. ULVN23_4]
MTDQQNTTPQPTGSAGPETGKGVHWSRIVLVVSLALNIAILGIVGGALMRWNAGMERARTQQARDFGFGPFVGALETEDRRSLGRAFAQSAGNPREAREKVGAMFDAMLAALRADDFDADGFEALLSKQQQEFARGQRIGAKLVAKQISEMSVEQRKAYAERLEEFLRNPPRPPHQQGNGGPGKGGPGKGPSD